MKLLLDHPETKERIAAINAAAMPRETLAFLSAAEWSALKQICAPLPAKDATTGRDATTGSGNAK